MMVHDSIIKSEHVVAPSRLIENQQMTTHEIKFTHKSGESSSYCDEILGRKLSTDVQLSLSEAEDVQFLTNYYSSVKYPINYRTHLPTNDIICNKTSEGIHTHRLARSMAHYLKLFPDFIDNVDFIVSVPNESTGWHSKFKANSIANNLSLYIKQFYKKNIPVKQFLKKTMKTNMKFMYRNQRLDFFIKNPNVYCVTSDSNFEGKTVLLVDDIITSGATMGSCLKKITSSGGKVYCFAAAQTMS